MHLQSPEHCTCLSEVMSLYTGAHEQPACRALSAGPQRITDVRAACIGCTLGALHKHLLEASEGRLHVCTEPPAGVAVEHG